MTGVAAHLNALDEDDARTALLRCCACEEWADAMLTERPFASDEALFEASDRLWGSLTPAHWREAFAAHPRIGGKVNATSSTAAWSRGEQSGMDSASASVAEALAEGNAAYEARFGHVFLICATGRSAEEMLAALTSRLQNDSETELRIAKEQQALITRLRLTKLVNA